MPVSVRKIEKSFGPKEVLKGVDLILEDGGIYCLMSPSGMGKTTLLRILMALEHPDSGRIEGLGKNDIAVMFQENRLLEWMSAVDNVAVMRHGVHDRELKRELEENLKLILPEDCLHQPVMQLSGGMKRRVALARAMNFPSKMIILDEPFTGLDRETKLNVIEYIHRMRRDRILLVATHGVEDAALLGAKVIRLEELLGREAPDADELDAENLILTREEVMKNMNLFRGIPQSRYSEMIEKLGGYETAYETEEVVWHEGETHNCIGVILQGAIRACEHNGKEPQIVQQFQAGDCFGEAVAFGEQKSWVEIRAVKPTRILYLQVDKLMSNVIDCDFSLMKTNLVREMSNKISILNLKNQILAEPRLRRRVLLYLNVLPVDKDGFREIPFSQRDFAQYLSANRSALSRELAHMREDGIIETDGRNIRVLASIPELLSKEEFGH